MDITSIIRNLIIAAPVILIAITFHEVAHGYVANKLGDPTAKMMGRLKLNPLVHIDPIGTILFPLMLFIMTKGQFIFGSAKPVPVNFLNLRNPKRDSALVSVAGPATNVLLAFVSVLLFLITYKLHSPYDPPSFFSEKIIYPIQTMLDYSIKFNILLAAFNLLPIPPLDGGRILTSLLPTKHAYHFEKIEPYGIFIVLILVITGVAWWIIAPIQAFIRFILGILLIPFGG